MTENPCFHHGCVVAGTHHVTPGRYLCCRHFEEYVAAQLRRTQRTLAPHGQSRHDGD